MLLRYSLHAVQGGSGLDNILYDCSNESYSAVLPFALFIKHHEVVLKSVDKTLGFYHSNGSHREVFLCVSLHYIL